ncbi:MAG: hypothetical protein WAN20_14660 [Pseudonocardiaceae bacterium]
MLKALHAEFTKLSAKKQDGALNALKIRNVNRLLSALQSIIDLDPAREYLEVLDEETLPDNSDVVIILSQWLAALEQFKQVHYGYDAGASQHRWFTTDSPSRGSWHS